MSSITSRRKSRSKNHRSAVMEDGDPEVIAAAMQDIDRARELLARQNSV
jgi:DNA-binding phage protein